MTQLSCYACNCESDEKILLTCDGGSAENYQLLLCKTCREEESDFIIKQENIKNELKNMSVTS